MAKQTFYLTALLLCSCLFYTKAKSQSAPQRLSLGFSIGIDKITSEILVKAKAHGIDYIETSVNRYIDSTGNFLLTDAEMMAKVKAAKKMADDAGIQIWSIHMPFGKLIDISLSDSAGRPAVLELHKKVLEFCKILKPKIILFHPSWFLGLNERSFRKNQMIKSVVELNIAVKAISATMVIENMFGPGLLRDKRRERPLFRTVEESVEMMNRLPADIYSAIDLNHIKNPEQLIYAMGSRLKTLHVADGTDTAENHFFPCSGQGHNDWVAILTAINAVGYKGPFMYECKYKDVSEFKTCYESLYRSFIQSMNKTDQ